MLCRVVLRCVVVLWSGVLGYLVFWCVAFGEQYFVVLCCVVLCCGLFGCVVFRCVILVGGSYCLYVLIWMVLRSDDALYCVVKSSVGCFVVLCCVVLCCVVFSCVLLCGVAGCSVWLYCVVGSCVVSGRVVLS